MRTYIRPGRPVKGVDKSPSYLYAFRCTTRETAPGSAYGKPIIKEDCSMQYRFLGRSGVKVSCIALGSQTFGWVTGEQDAHRMLDRFVDRGGTLIDSANIYNEGESERILGTWLRKRGRRDDLLLATKVFFPTGEGPNDTGLTRKHLLEQIDRSLHRLETDYVDLYQMHCFDQSTPLEETLSALDRLVQQGKVRYTGASNFTASQLVRALMLQRGSGMEPLMTLQPEYSLLVRETEWELIPLCMEEGLGVLPWSPLAGGWLSGKYHRGKPPPSDSRVGRKDRWDDLPAQRESERTWHIVDTLRRVAEKHCRTPAQAALNWLVNRPGVTCPIIGARTMEQLDENLGSIGWNLDCEDIKALDNASVLDIPYPFRFIQRYTRHRDHPQTDAGTK